MYSIEKTTYGYKLTFAGFIKQDEMARWGAEVRALAAPTGPFSIFIEMRDLKPLPVESQEEMQKGQVLFKQRGLARAVVVVAGPTIAMQFKRIAKETGIDAWERYVDVTRPNFEKLALGWVEKGIDPDASAKAA
jgi:hypothetical protein